MQRHIFGGAADFHGISARIRVPVFCGRVIEGKGARVERNRDVLGFAGREVHAGEAFQLFRWARYFRIGLGYVDLSHVCAQALASIGNVKCHVVTGAG